MNSLSRNIKSIYMPKENEVFNKAAFTIHIVVDMGDLIGKYDVISMCHEV